jgi:hypothetical protein
MTPPQQRTAQPGDIFILLVPTAQELHLLRQRQSDLAARYGGQVVANPHITCQRFSPNLAEPKSDCVAKLKTKLETIPRFPLYSDRLIQFYAPYWQNMVLRWRVQVTRPFAAFRNKLDRTLARLDCPSHFNRVRHASCTAINLEKAIDLQANPAHGEFPTPLFTARECWVSALQEDGQFTILETIKLGPAP